MKNINYKNKPLLIITLGSLLIIANLGCRKSVEADAPKTSLSQANVYESEVAAISVLTGLYQEINQSGLFSGSSGISLLVGLYADEFTLSTEVSATDTKAFYYRDTLFSRISGNMGTEFWSPFYKCIFRCNAAIEGLSTSHLTDAVKQQLLGEAKFLRGLFYFYLVNLYGPVPLVISTDWQVNATLSRASELNVYQQIISDLQEAQILLHESYLDGKLQPYSNSVERVRPTKWAAKALLAKVYLYTGKYSDAESEASAIINNTTLFGPISSVSLSDVFLKNSREAIWQLQPINSGQNTSDAALFLLPSTGPSSSYPVYLSPQLLAAFDPSDQRRFNRNWIDSIKVGTGSPVTYYFPFKYKVGVNSATTTISQLKEYLMVLRLGELYLIRAEARAQQNNLTEALRDLNSIRNRAGLTNFITLDKSSLLTAILKERQIELFSELGNRWFDLKRTNNADAVMNVVRPLKANNAPWSSYRNLFPILLSDIQRNINLTQNLGYE